MNIKRWIKNAKIKTNPHVNQVVLNNLLNTLDKSKSEHSADVQLSVWRIIMSSKITKFAVAAIIIIAVYVGINQFGGLFSDAGVVWAEVADKIDLMPAFTHRSKRIIICDGKEIPSLTSDVVTYYSPEYGIREDARNQSGRLIHQVYILWREGLSVTIQPALRQYKTVELAAPDVEQFRITLKQLIQPLRSGQYTELGSKIIDGVEVEGVEISDPCLFAGSIYPIKFDSVVIRLWVDVRTSLPFRADADSVTSDKYITVFTGGKPAEVKAVMDEFQWDVQLDQGIFELNVPDDFTLMTDETDSRDEGKAVLGLQNFAQLTGGKYPGSLNLIAVIKESHERIKNADGINIAGCKAIKALRPACLFYGELVKQNKDVVYNGSAVTAEDTDAVLMRWKIADNEYRVIFSDLAAENVSAERLAELEKRQ